MNNDLFVKAVIFLFNLGIIHHRQGVLHTHSVFRPLKIKTQLILFWSKTLVKANHNDKPVRVRRIFSSKTWISKR